MFVCKSKTTLLFLELISGFTTGALAKKFLFNKTTRHSLPRQKFSSRMLISFPRNSSSICKSVVFNQLYHSILVVILGLLVDALASDKPPSLYTLRIPWTTLFDFSTICAIAPILRLSFIRSLIICWRIGR